MFITCRRISEMMKFFLEKFESTGKTTIQHLLNTINHWWTTEHEHTNMLHRLKEWSRLE